MATKASFNANQWEMLKKGDAQMRPSYGIRGVLNLFVLFYAIVWVLLLKVGRWGVGVARPSSGDWVLPMSAACSGGPWASSTRGEVSSPGWGGISCRGSCASRCRHIS